ncbi:MAG TPA: YbjN domain-containing protein [Candidatus Aveggerthella stercoripullorum]|uniref:YbjN domain-containing protein n=1 Tax=Candidatus Aveggerthella stercoripullorum TaxID=2840688 RepID=A0A9D1D323_9ACTN|nr:YbjN domain-containing protein [Candidatus Aveggerthella stercoripullorum]
MNYGIAIAALFSAYLETNGYKHRHDEDSDIVVIGFVGNYESFDGITVLMKFGDDGEDVQIQAPDFAVVPEAGRAQAMFACNKVNERYRWVKFAVSEGGQLRLTSDIPIEATMSDNDLCGLLLTSMRRFIRVADHAYGMFCEYVDMSMANDVETDPEQETEDGQNEGLSFYAVNDEGESVECEAILTFEHEGRNFIVYTDNTTNRDGSTRVYASICKDEPETVQDCGFVALGLMPITDKADWELVEQALDSLSGD